ncbi:sugar phosphate isomerase/epimerase family protein [Paenibacillus sp. CAU 1782]
MTELSDRAELPMPVNGQVEQQSHHMPKKPSAGLQMYSLRDESERDMLGTLDKVAEIGYKTVEAAGYFNATPDGLRERADSLDISIPSTLVALNFKELGKLQSDFAEQVKMARELGVSYIVVPWIPMQESPSMEDITFLSGVLKRCGEQAQKAGIQLSLHNHEYEWKLVDGKPAYDRLMEAVNEESKLLDSALDVGYLKLAGGSLLDFLERYRGKVPIAHIRDFKNGRMDTELGEGVLHCEQYVKELERAGVDYLFVEQENFEGSSLQSAKTNFQFLQRMGLV